MNNKFYSASVIYNYEENRAIKKYQSIVAMLKEKYGDPDKNELYFKKPYYYGDGHEELALKVNKASIFSEWVFSDNNAIRCAVGSQLRTAIIYTNVQLDKESTELEKAKNNKDL